MLVSFLFLFKESLFTVLEHHALSTQRNVNRRACTYDFQRDVFLSNNCGMDLGARSIAHIMVNGIDFAHRILSEYLRQTVRWGFGMAALLHKCYVCLTSFIVICETCIVFLEFVESLIKISDKCKIRTRFVKSTSLPPRCFICSILNAVYSVPLMWSIQCFICDLSSASYVVYSVLHMWSTQCFICDLFSAPYVAYSVLHM